MNREVYNGIKEQLGWKPAPAASGSGRALIVSVQVNGDTAYVSGHVPFSGGELLYKGRIGADLSLEQARNSAALSTINCLESVDRIVGLDRVEQVLKVTGYLSCVESYTDHPTVMNAASELLLDVFGDAGAHARAALGIHTLPLGSSTEVDMVIKLKPGV